MMRTLLVANPKGGSGKTTLATNIAGYLANRNERVVLWDLDRQRSALKWLEARSEELPRIAPFNSKQEENLGGVNWLVLDSPAGLHGKSLTRLLKLADKVVVPVQPSLFDMEATRDFMQVLSEAKAVRKQNTLVSMVGMRVDPRTRASSHLEAFLGEFDLPVLAYLRNTQIYVNSAFEGCSIFDLPENLARRDLEQWAPLLEWIED
ncbi:MAG: nucleotide-binding protein [Burkholderiales bacterium]